MFNFFKDRKNKEKKEISSIKKEISDREKKLPMPSISSFEIEDANTPGKIIILFAELQAEEKRMKKIVNWVKNGEYEKTTSSIISMRNCTTDNPANLSTENITVFKFPDGSTINKPQMRGIKLHIKTGKFWPEYWNPDSIGSIY